MEAYPGSDEDLDSLTENALVANNPNATLKEAGGKWGGDYPLIATLIQRGRLDLADALFAVGATVPINVADHEAEVSYFQRHGVVFDEDSLSYAVRHGRWGAVLALIDSGLDVNMPVTNFWVRPGGIEGIRPLHVAAWQGAVPIVYSLLERGANPELTDSENMTALMKACDLKGRSSEGNPASVYWLLEAQANPNAKTPAGDTSLLLCLAHKLKDWSACEQVEIAAMLLRYKADPNVVSPAGTTPLMLAARNDSASVVRALLKAGANSQAKTPDGRTALDVAIKWKSEAAAEVLRGR